MRSALVALAAVASVSAASCAGDSVLTNGVCVPPGYSVCRSRQAACPEGSRCHINTHGREVCCPEGSKCENDEDTNRFSILTGGAITRPGRRSVASGRGKAAAARRGYFEDDGEDQDAVDSQDADAEEPRFEPIPDGHRQKREFPENPVKLPSKSNEARPPLLAETPDEDEDSNSGNSRNSNAGTDEDDDSVSTRRAPQQTATGTETDLEMETGTGTGGTRGGRPTGTGTLDDLDATTGTNTGFPTGTDSLSPTGTGDGPNSNNGNMQDDPNGLGDEDPDSAAASLLSMPSYAFGIALAAMLVLQ